MQGQVKFYALGAAALIFGAFQAPGLATAFPQFTPSKSPRAVRAKADGQVREGAEFVDPTVPPAGVQDVSGQPESGEPGTAPPPAKTAASIGTRFHARAQEEPRQAVLRPEGGH